MLLYNEPLFYNNLIIIPESQQCHSYTFIKTFFNARYIDYLSLTYATNKNRILKSPL